MTDFQKFVDRAKWNWAKTYADKAPHWYCVRAEFGDNKTFDEVVEYMRKNSRTEYFFRHPFQYFYYGGYKYWTMGNPIKETTIINRAKV